MDCGVVQEAKESNLQIARMVLIVRGGSSLLKIDRDLFFFQYALRHWCSFFYILRLWAVLGESCRMQSCGYMS